MPKVSVIIPVYNVEKYLKRCLDSVLNQTLRDIEIICINDGSTDNSVQILEEYGAKIKVIDTKNKGVSVARNAGLEVANGDFIAFLDSDDYVDADFYEKLYKNATEYNADIACSSILRENEKSKTYIIKYSETVTAKDIQERFNLADCPKNNFVWNKIYKKSFLDENKILFVPGMIYEDMCFTPDVLAASKCLITVSGTNYHYWKHNGSLIKCNSEKSREDKLKAHKYLMRICKKYNLKVSPKDLLILRREFFIFGIKILQIKKYRVTQKFYLFGFIKILEIKDRI